jgi:hypothetical protein
MPKGARLVSRSYGAWVDGSAQLRRRAPGIKVAVAVRLMIGHIFWAISLVGIRS